MIRSNHYEAAIEANMRAKNIGYVAVDEAKRTRLGTTDIKSVDFIVVGPESAKLVVDVKGRQYPGRSGSTINKTWQNWTEAEDIDGLERWATEFGTAFRGVLAFVYHILPPFVLPTNTPDLFSFRNGTYLMRGVAVAEYKQTMRVRSPKWGTVHMPMESFRRSVRPFSHFLGPRHTGPQPGP